jgi:hypothetical protein
VTRADAPGSPSISDTRLFGHSSESGQDMNLLKSAGTPHRTRISLLVEGVMGRRVPGEKTWTKNSDLPMSISLYLALANCVGQRAITLVPWTVVGCATELGWHRHAGSIAHETVAKPQPSPPALPNPLSRRSRH